MSKRERDIILRRRARFISVALAGVGLAASLESCKSEPQVCLQVTATTPDAGPSATATPCLSPPIDRPDAAADSGAESQSDAGLRPQPRPRPVRPDKPPRPCLSPID